MQIVCDQRLVGFLDSKEKWAVFYGLKTRGPDLLRLNTRKIEDLSKRTFKTYVVLKIKYKGSGSKPKFKDKDNGA